ncbi:hypothetical protein PPTG_17890 [Phytophthora nicotianae INRA-310]|uniref:Uncharacterized protein n=1 Tax=Phytophthora nicotianae (strain INRA-310) TaxID=761204 RepID=W2PKX7_PHYN3|nr:hypothetical protein PPTG_17890 [Phytophthora nicotianae INRA-310]ETN00690.1 hypothetical protein PPTG_17890 [Phytophthora nicotianae INRA-310]
MLNLMRHWWNQSIHQHKAIISDSQIKMQNRLRRKLFAGVWSLLKNYWVAVLS